MHIPRLWNYDLLFSIRQPEVLGRIVIHNNTQLLRHGITWDVRIFKE